jgi:hypothetical protein
MLFDPNLMKQRSKKTKMKVFQRLKQIKQTFFLPKDLHKVAKKNNNK